MADQMSERWMNVLMSEVNSLKYSGKKANGLMGKC